MAGHAWPRAAQRTNTARRPAKGQRKREKPADDGDDAPEGLKAGRAKEDPRESSYTECCTGQHRIERVVDSDDRKTATTSRKWQGARA